MARKDSGSADATDPLMKMIGLRWRMSGGKVAALCLRQNLQIIAADTFSTELRIKKRWTVIWTKKVAQFCFNVILLYASK